MGKNDTKTVFGYQKPVEEKKVVEEKIVKEIVAALEEDAVIEVLHIVEPIIEAPKPLSVSEEKRLRRTGGL